MRRNSVSMMAGLIALSLGLLPEALGSGVTVTTITLDQKIPAPRWMFDPKAMPKATGLTAVMIDAKKAQMEKERGKCISALAKAYPLGKSLGPWIALNHLQCAQLRDKAGKLNLPAVKEAIAKVDAQPRWLLNGSAASGLRSAYTSALLGMAEQQVKSDRAGAWKSIDKLQQVRPWLSTEERANVYRWAGELAFIEQNLGAAQDFFLRSLNEKESADLRAKVDSIRSTLLGKKKGPPPPQPVAKTDDVGMTEEERDLTTRMQRALAAQEYVPAVEDGIKLLQKFPGSKRTTEAAEKILDIYLSLATRSEEKFRNVRESIVKEMLKADAGRLNRWAANAYARGNYIDALNLAERAYEKYGGQVEGTKILLLAGKAAVSAGEYGEATESFERLIRYHGGTVEAAEATFRLGLLEFRRKRYGEASANFERVGALASGSDFEYRSLYWQWRAQQKIDAKQALPLGQALVSRYPYSYYGLRALAELNNNEIKLADGGETPIKIEWRLLESERLTWERLLMLLRAGWFKEAEKELDALPEPSSAEELVVRARLWALAMRYDLAIQDVSKAIEQEPKLANLTVLKVVFPKEYAQWIAREAKVQSLDEDVVRSLIRQESSFRVDVRSPANAMGLMQLLPSTGAEIAKDLKLRNYEGQESLLNPEINIKLGTTYLARLLRNFNGHLPLALAAYNAGPTRLRRWMNARRDLGPSDSAPSSSPESEIWMDELPWDETSFYVKSILRNWMIYRLMDGSKLSLNEPIWMDGKAVTR